MEIKKIFFDMDGVVADFDGYLEDKFQIPDARYRERSEEDRERMWVCAAQVPHFYDQLPEIEGAKALFDEVYAQYGDKVEILTGIPKPKRNMPTAGDDKASWAHRILNPNVVVNIVYKEDKPDYCTGPDCILIDDTKRNIEAWKEMGGTGVLFKDVASAREILNSMGIL